MKHTAESKLLSTYIATVAFFSDNLFISASKSQLAIMVSNSFISEECEIDTKGVKVWPVISLIEIK